ncbi:MAG: EamA family transporter [Eubacteriales bacterium]
MVKYYAVLVIMTILGSFGAYFLKKATSVESSLFRTFFKKEIYIGGSLYFLSALINIYILKFIDYTIVLPLTSLSYIWTMVIAGIIMKEKIGRNKVIGVACILIGAVFVGIG